MVWCTFGASILSWTMSHFRLLSWLSLGDDNILGKGWDTHTTHHTQHTTHRNTTQLIFIHAHTYTYTYTRAQKHIQNRKKKAALPPLDPFIARLLHLSPERKKKKRQGNKTLLATACVSLMGPWHRKWYMANGTAPLACLSVLSPSLSPFFFPSNPPIPVSSNVARQ